MAGGGNVAHAINKYFLPYAEYSYFSEIGRERDTFLARFNQTVRTRYSIPVSDVNAGVHLRLPVRESRIVPYVVLGIGALYSSEQRVTARFEPVGGAEFTNLNLDGSTDFAVNFGGGLRYYANHRFGMRLEAKAYKSTGDSASVFGKVTFGFFFQFR
ncbi:MAG: hypothetical protein H7Y20_07505 [Bryobacteraceae bacterium]|nr:hypothetical protein [Bryobacteraceae bacterium]